MPKKSSGRDILIQMILKKATQPLTIHDITVTILNNKNPRLIEYHNMSSSVRYHLNYMHRQGDVIKDLHKNKYLWSWKKDAPITTESTETKKE